MREQIDFCQIKNFKYLEIISGIHTYFGGNQLWYPTSWKTKAGCGPTNASLFLMYLALSHDEYNRLAPADVQNKDSFISFMNVIWDYVTPTPMGVNSTTLFKEGVEKYAEEKGVTLICCDMHISKTKDKRPTEKSLTKFICEGLNKNSIVAFLNFSNGEEAKLDSWHWVSIVSFEPATGTAFIADEGLQKEINMYTWLSTTKLGGGLVALA